MGNGVFFVTRVYLVLGLIAAFVLIRFLAYPILKKRWPFWHSFSWRPGKWQDAFGYYHDAWQAVKRYPWFLVIPLSITFLSLLIIAWRTLPMFLHSAKPQINHLLSVSEQTKFFSVQSIISSLAEALGSLEIIWAGITTTLFSILFIIGYNLFMVFNIKNFRRLFFLERSTSPFCLILHIVGLIVSIITLVIFLPSLIHGLAPLPGWIGRIFILGIPLISIITYLGSLSFHVFFLIISLKLIQRILSKPLVSCWQIKERNFWEVLGFLILSDLVLFQGYRLSGVVKYMVSILFGASTVSLDIVTALYNTFYTLLMNLLLFTSIFMVIGEKRLFGSMKQSVEFILKNFVPFVQLALISLPLPFMLNVAGCYLSRMMVTSSSPLVSRFAFYLWRIVIPSIYVAVEIFISLALARFWLLRRSDDEKYILQSM